MIGHGMLPSSGDALFSWSVPSLDALRLDRAALPSPQFACLLACDARGVADEVVFTTAERLLDSGLAYFCAWGPDCERVHDLVDEAIVLREVGEGRAYPVMTTWHSDESLDDALWFMANTACPHELYRATCKSRVAISVGEADWERLICEGFASMTGAPDGNRA
ncbi:MAG: hypothetical protein M3Q29_16790 [Chloroflexota bacterium]|nr:hypothetical protein [Chloroflexota bacterium]